MSMKETVIIYEKNREIAQALHSFLSNNDNRQIEFVRDSKALKKHISKSSGRNTLCIVMVDELSSLKPEKLNCPVIATIAKETGRGIKKAIRYHADNYLIHPIHGDDLEYKIRSAFEKRRTIETLKREATDLQTIVELTHLVSSTLDPREILFLVVKKIAEIIPVTRCSIIRVESRSRYAYVVATCEDPNITNIKLDLRKYPEISKALLSRKPVLIDNVAIDPLMKKMRDLLYILGIRSIMVIPIIFHEEVIGTLFLRTSRTGYAFNSNEIRFCHAIANAAANSLYNAFLFERIGYEKTRLEKLAITDYLTGVYNIRYFYHRLSEEFSRSQRHNFSLSCLMFDIDLFKEINDRYGHKAGDSILREFAQAVKKLTRKSDVFARYGGEEFIMLLPETDQKGALTKAEAIRTFIEKYTFTGLKKKKGLTVSIGIATYPGSGIKSKDDLITFSDNGLYDAKATGRNKVVFYKP